MKVQVQPPAVREVVITLTEKEAEFLSEMCVSVNGDQDSAAWKFADKLYRTLDQHGVNFGMCAFDGEIEAKKEEDASEG